MKDACNWDWASLAIVSVWALVRYRTTTLAKSIASESSSTVLESVVEVPVAVVVAAAAVDVAVVSVTMADCLFPIQQWLLPAPSSRLW